MRHRHSHELYGDNIMRRCSVWNKLVKSQDVQSKVVIPAKRLDIERSN